MEKLLLRINGFGKYQKFILILIGLICSLTAFTVYASIFTSAQHGLKCVHKIHNTTAANSCKIWTSMKSNSTQKDEYTCTFSNEYYGNTLVSEWGLQCDKMYVVSFLQTIFMVGCMFTLVSGWLSDQYGRRTIMIYSAIFLSATTIVTEILIQKFEFDFNTQYSIYIASQFLVGLLGNSLYITSYILICELTSARYGTFISTFSLYMYVVGELILLSFSYFNRDWHSINSFIAIASTVLAIFIVLLIPESPRFLISSKYYEQCYSVLLKIAKVNGRTHRMFSKESFFKQIESNRNGTIDSHKRELEDNVIARSTNFNEIQSLLNIKFKGSGNDDRDVEILEKNSGSVIFFLFNPVKNLFITLAMSYVWVALSMIYFGVSLGIISLGENFNPYISYLMSCVAEAFGYSLCFLNNKYSRKKVLICFISFASFFCLLVSTIPKDKIEETTWRTVLTILFATFGKAAASASFNSIFVYTFLMFPTNVRNTLFAFCGSASRIGCLISPQVNLLRNLVWAPLPYIIFSSTAILSGFFLMFLPDPSNFV